MAEICMSITAEKVAEMLEEQVIKEIRARLMHLHRRPNCEHFRE